MKLALYARVSTAGERGGKIQSCEPQLLDMRLYAELHDHEVVAEYRDEGVSGLKSKRPALDRMLKDLATGAFEGIVVWRFDRFGRSVMHLLQSLQDFQARGVAFISVQENLDTSTPTGKAMFTIISAIAQLERDILSERTKAGLRAAVARGAKPGRPTKPIDLERLMELRMLGYSMHEVARRMGFSVGKIWDTLHGKSRKKLQLTQ
jgi:DNA invertase Pin-like site-specific DNA recombinase